MLFRQLFDAASSTYTYLLADTASGDALLIDPVFEQSTRDLSLLHELGLTLKLVVDTHAHADHVTAAWLLKQKTGCQIASAAVINAEYVDLPLHHGQRFGVKGVELEARATPGHTDGCMSFVLADHSHVFTMAGYPRRGNDILGLVVPPSDGGKAETPALATDGKPYTTLGYGNGPGAIKPDATGGRATPETGVAAYQQAAIPTGAETHGGEDVALYANGPGAQNVRGVMEQNLIYNVIRRAFGWED